MIWHIKVVRACLIAGVASGCAGTGHKLPEITDAERARALSEISVAPSLQTVQRSSTENERLARTVLNRLQSAAQPVCKKLERDNCHYPLTYVREPKVNAGISQNRMVFYDGLAQYLETEDEFAAIIGHEMGHHLSFHYEEDAQNRAVGAVIAGLIFGGLAAATGAYQYDPGGFQRGMNSMSRFGAAIGDISFSKEQESEADYLGAYLMTRAGFDPEKGKQIWIKLSKLSGRTKTALLDTHPAGPDRLAAWYKSVEEVRYSADLMPNPIGSDDEARLQVARSFGPSVMDAPSPQVAAVAGESKIAAVITGPETTDIPSPMATASPDREPLAWSMTGDTLVPRAPGPASEATARFATVTSWPGLGGPLDGTLAMTPTGETGGQLRLHLDTADDSPETRCEGIWNRTYYVGDMTVGVLTMACDNGLNAEGGYRLDETNEGLAGLTDSQGNFVELKLTRL